MSVKKDLIDIELKLKVGKLDTKGLNAIYKKLYEIEANHLKKIRVLNEAENKKLLAAFQHYQDARQKSIEKAGQDQIRNANKVHKTILNGYRSMISQMNKLRVKLNIDERKGDEETVKKKLSLWKKFFNSLHSLSAKAGTLIGYKIAALPMEALNGLYETFKKVIAVAIEYQRVLLELSARGGFTAQETKKLAGTFLAVASATKYSFSEIAKASIIMAKLGLNADELSKAMMPVAETAAAAGESIADVGHAMSVAKNIFHLSVDDFTTLGDVMTNAFTSSALDLHTFETAMSYAGAAANSTNTNVVELTASMAVLADNGITASKMGTGLRKIFQELGEEGYNLTDILKEMHDGTLSYFKAQELVGARAANQLLILSQNYDEYRNKIEEYWDKTGSSADRATIQMQGLGAKWTVVWNEMEATAAQKSQGIIKWMGNMLDVYRAYTGKGVHEVVTQWAKDNRDLAESFKPNQDYDTEKAWEQLPLKIRVAVERGMKMSGMKSRGAYIQQIILGIDDYSKKQKLNAKQMRYVSETTRDITKQVQKLIEYNTPSEATSYLKGQQTYFKKLVEQNIIAPNEGVKIQKYLKTELGKIDKGSAWKDLTKDIDNYIGSFDKKVVTRDPKNGGRLKFVDNIAKELDMSEQEITKVMRHVEAYNKRLDEMCKAGILEACKKSKSGSGAGAFNEGAYKFHEDKAIKSDYETTKARLNAEFNLVSTSADDKRRIQQEMIANEIDYAKKYKKQKEEYLTYVKGYIAKMSKLDTIAAKTNVHIAKEYQATTEQDIAGVRGDRNKRVYQDRAKKIKFEYDSKWKPDLDAFQIYRDKMRPLIKQMNGDMYGESKWKHMAKAREMTNKFYDGQIADADKAIKKLEASVGKEDSKNAMYKLLGLDFKMSDTKDAHNQIKAMKNTKAMWEDQKKKLDDKYTMSENDRASMDIQIWTNAYSNIADTFTQFNDMKLQALQDATDREMEIIERRYEAEREMQEGAVSNGNLSLEEAADARMRSDKKRVEDENKVQKKLFEAKKKADMENAILSGIAQEAQAIATAIAQQPYIGWAYGAIAAAAIAAQTTMRVSAISSRKFSPVKYADGGFIEGRSHAEGGVPFLVQGELQEYEGGEFVVKKDRAAKYSELLKAINGDSKPAKSGYYATGGTITPSGASATSDLGEVLEALKQPVRAYVTSQDLEYSESERRALTEKSTY